MQEQKQCPKCKQPFICNSNAIKDCQCSKVQLSQKTIDFLANTYFDCLCGNCLTNINEAVAMAAHYQFPTKTHEFIEGVHFYKEGNNVVFTTIYHILRGYCCGNGCRHCAYGYKK